MKFSESQVKQLLDAGFGASSVSLTLHGYQLNERAIVCSPMSSGYRVYLFSEYENAFEFEAEFETLDEAMASC